MGNDPFSMQQYTPKTYDIDSRSQVKEYLSQKGSDSLANWIAFAICAPILLVVSGPFIPFILVSLVFGWVLWSARYQFTANAAIRAYLSALLILAITAYILWGLPIRVPGQLFFGFGTGAPLTNRVLLSFMEFWDEIFTVHFRTHFGNFDWWLNSKLEYFRIYNIRHQTIGLLTWGVVPASILFSGCFMFIERFFGMEPKTGPIKRAFTNIPKLIFKTPAFLLFEIWTKMGFKLTRKSAPMSARIIYGLGYFLMVGIFFGFFAVFFTFVNAPIDPVIRVLLVTAFATPVLGSLFGIGVGFSGEHGDKAYENIFGAMPPMPPMMSLVPDFNGKRTSGVGFQLGKTFRGFPYELSEENLAYHIELIAPTGAGKTNLLKNLMFDRIKRGHTILFLDFKAEFDVANWMYGAAKSVGREEGVRFLSLADPELSVPYNPIKFGSAPEIHSQIMGSFSWDHEFYHAKSSDALMTILRGLTEYRQKTGKLFHIGHVHSLFMKPGKLRLFAQRLSELKLPAAEDCLDLAAKLDRPQDAENFAGLISKLNILVHSKAGPLLTEDVKAGSFDFREALTSGRTTCVLINSMMLKESAQVLSKIILQDLISIVGDRFSKKGKKSEVEPINRAPITLVIDEFASFAVPEFADLLDKIRGAGIGVVMAHQSRSDLARVSEDFQKRIEANCNTVIVSGVKDSKDAEYYAGMLGTRTTTKATAQMKTMLFWKFRTGVESEREVEEFVVHPNKLKGLEQGQVFTISQTIDPKWGLVNVPRAPEFDGPGTYDVEEVMKARRDQYMTATGESYLDLSNFRAAGSKTAKDGKPQTDKAEKQLWE